jgi:hypothetical protein
MARAAPSAPPPTPGPISEQDLRRQAIAELNERDTRTDEQLGRYIDV